MSGSSASTRERRSPSSEIPGALVSKTTQARDLAHAIDRRLTAVFTEQAAGVVKAVRENGGTAEQAETVRAVVLEQFEAARDVLAAQAMRVFTSAPTLLLGPDFRSAAVDG